MNFDSQILNVPVEDIIPNRFQPRLNFDDDSLQQLADSIRQHGIIQPLVLRKTDDKYEIIAGERRYKAAKMAGLTSVPAVISKIDDKTSAEVAIAENVQRKQISSIEEAKSYKALLDLGYMTTEMLAQKMGIPESSLKNKLRLLDLNEEVQNAVIEGRISERHAKALLKLSNANDQIFWLNRIINERLTVKQLDDAISNQKESGNMNESVQNNLGSVEATSPISLGTAQSTQMLNDLESESANMNMSEPTSIFGTQPVTNNASTLNQIDSLDTLDITPSQESTPSIITNNEIKQKPDSSIAFSKISSLVNELRSQGYNITINSSDNIDKLTINLDILK